MKLELAEKIVETLSNLGYEAEVYEDYSGRGMFGRTTAGIVTEISGVIVGFAAALAVADDTEAELVDDAEAGSAYQRLRDFNLRELPLNRDNMGLSTIYY